MKTKFTKKIKFHHESKIAGGHAGILRTYNKIKNYFKFPNMKNKIAEYIKNCD